LLLGWSGLWKRRVSCPSITRVVEQILSAFENNEYCNAIFLDVLKAFERVWHSGLLLQIKNTRPAPYFGLLRSYLEKRRFAVRFHSALSNEHNAAAGVPQGSVLGPLLHCLYSYDMPRPDVSLPGTSMLVTFAVDVCVTYRSFADFASTFAQWARRWNNVINGDKSANVCYTLKMRTPPAVLIDGTPVPQSNSAKYLGVILDRRLNFSKQKSAYTCSSHKALLAN